MSLSTHVLDVSLGRPAADLGVHLERREGDAWQSLGRSRTDEDGRGRELLPPDAWKGEETEYRLTFEVTPYFESQSVAAFYPLVQITFIVRDASHHHVPLLLSPFGYSTYRGS